MPTVNPNMLIQMIRQGNNPQQLMLTILKNQMGGTPMGQNLIGLIESGRTGDIEQIARNIAKQRGIDFDKEFNSFKQMLGIK